LVNVYIKLFDFEMLADDMRTAMFHVMILLSLYALIR